jgi:nitrite reductase/ring-hydroxylating ferredoxin subunit
MSDKAVGSPCESCESCEWSAGDPSRRAFLQLITAGAVITFVTGLRAGAEARYPIPAGDGVTIDKKAQVIIVRYQGHAYAFNLACPHQNQMLRWLPKEGRFQCPKHESKYQPTGVFINGRATRNMDRLALRVDGDSLVVNVDKMFMSDKDPAGWAAATVTI